MARVIAILASGDLAILELRLNQLLELAAAIEDSVGPYSRSKGDLDGDEGRALLIPPERQPRHPSAEHSKQSNA